MNRIAFDTETWLIAACCAAPPLVCTSWATPDGAAGIFDRTGNAGAVAVPQIYESWLSGETITHNGSYDWAVIAARYPELIPAIFEAYAKGRIKCTLIREKLRDIAFGEFRWRKHADGTSEKINYGLADVAKRRLGVHMAKTKTKTIKGQVFAEGEDTWRLRYRELYNTPIEQWPPDAVSYPIDDAKHPLAIFDQQERERAAVFARAGVDIFADEARQTRSAWWLQLVSCTGMPLDPTKVDALEIAITTERKELEDLLVDEGLVRVDYYRDGRIKKYTRDMKAAHAYMIELCAELGVPVKMTKGGEKSGPAVCLDAEACTDTGDEVMIAYSNYAALGNVLGKDIKAMHGVQRVHCGFDSLVASGRTSSRKIAQGVGGMNLQNLRREGKTRECFVAPPGYKFCLIDLEAAELYGVAQICRWLFGYSRLAEVLKEPKDPHVYLASRFAHVDYESYFAAYKAGDQFVKRSRQVSKNANYALWGLVGAKRLAALIKTQSKGKIRIDLDEAKAQILAWKATWPEAQPYLDFYKNQCRDGAKGSIKQWRSDRIRGGLSASEMCNTGFQGLIADLMKDAGFVLSREMYDHTRRSVLFGSRIVNFPHDEFISLVPEQIAHDCAMRIQTIVREKIAEWCPDVQAPAVAYLADYWTKDAKPTYDENGKLIPWKRAA